jgi:hypothetical protein
VMKITLGSFKMIRYIRYAYATQRMIRLGGRDRMDVVEFDGGQPGAYSYTT